MAPDEQLNHRQHALAHCSTGRQAAAATASEVRAGGGVEGTRVGLAVLGASKQARREPSRAICTQPQGALRVCSTLGARPPTHLCRCGRRGARKCTLRCGGSSLLHHNQAKRGGRAGARESAANCRGVPGLPPRRASITQHGTCSMLPAPLRTWQAVAWVHLTAQAVCALHHLHRAALPHLAHGA